METFLIGMADFQAQVLISATYLGKKNQQKLHRKQYEINGKKKKKFLTITRLQSSSALMFFFLLLLL